MDPEFGDWTGGGAAEIREQRSGLRGFGERPWLHPAWRTPADHDPLSGVVALDGGSANRVPVAKPRPGSDSERRSTPRST